MSETITIKKLIKPFVPQAILAKYKHQKQEREVREWKENGCYVPPPHIVKQLTIKAYQRKYNINTLVETGTFEGAMIEAQKTEFRKIISIELAPQLYLKAKQRFSKDKHVVIVHGDSGKVLSDILKDVKDPAIFWLDGHYSSGPTAKGDKDCPIFEELSAIFNSRKLNHILLIDDARCFVGKDDYPTIESLTEFIRSKNKAYRIDVKDDIIRCVTDPSGVIPAI